MPRISPRSGKVLVMFACLLPVILAGLALSVDLSIITIARSQLKVSADAAALGGAMQLADEYRVRGATNVSTEISNANTQATSLIQDPGNSVLNKNLVAVSNGSNSSSGDIVVGYLDTTKRSSTLDSSSGSASKYNSVQVTTYRNASHGTVVPSFFSAALGNKGTALSATSTATAQPYSIQGFQSGSNGQNSTLIPIVLDQTTYIQMTTGLPSLTQDVYAYNPTTGTVSSGSDGIHESDLYPVGSGAPGNWGTVKIGVSNNGTSTLSAQIQYGVTAAQLATYPNSTLQLSNSTTPPSVLLGGNPGISAGIKSALQAIIGQAVTIPIYTTVTGNGNNTQYTVVSFAAVRILDVNFQGNPKYVIVQPALVKDATAISSQPQSWTSGGLVRVFLSR